MRGRTVKALLILLLSLAVFGWSKEVRANDEAHVSFYHRFEVVEDEAEAGQEKGFYRFWKLPVSLEADAAEDILNRLSTKTEAELNAVGPVETDYDPTEAAAGVLRAGRYFVRKMIGKDSAVRFSDTVVPFIADIPEDVPGEAAAVPQPAIGTGAGEIQSPKDLPAGEKMTVSARKPVVIHPKSYVHKNAGLRLVKYGDEINDAKRLEGVAFRLYRLDGKREIPVRADAEGVSYGGEGTLFRTDRNGEILVQGLETGNYRFREVETLEGYRLETEPTDVLVSGIGTEVKIVNYKDDRGKKRFIKSDPEKKPLYGAAFKLYRVDMADGKESLTAVRRDGKDYVATSGKDGSFLFDNLPFGKYAAVETKTPEVDGVRYIRLKEPVYFEVGADDIEGDHVIYVINKPENPPQKPGKPGKPKVPRTGDIKIFLFTGIGTALILLGSVLNMRENRSVAKKNNQ